MLNLSVYGSSKPFQWSHGHLVKIVSTGQNPIITDPILLNAFRIVKRKDFVPENEQHLAYQDKHIELPYKSILPNPTTVARLIQTINPKYGQKILHIGSGSGYLPVILSIVTGDEGKVYSLERVQWLWEQARVNAYKYPQAENLELLYRDGKLGLPDKAKYDLIIFSAIPDFVSDDIRDQLADGGKIVVPTNKHQIKIIEPGTNGKDMEEVIPGFPSHIFGNIETGLA